jgi:hypothetical protein
MFKNSLPTYSGLPARASVIFVKYLIPVEKFKATGGNVAD